jgi:hypothetical protein
VAVGKFEESRSAAAVAAVFVALHALLLWRSCAIINLEEADWGNLAAAMLDGMAWSPVAFQEMDRQGMVQLLGPLKSLVYRVLGPSFFALKFTSILFAAATSGLMFAVLRRWAPQAGRWPTLALCVLPAPLVSGAATHAYGPASPFGAAFFFFACVLVLGSDRRGAAIAGGLLAGLGIWAGTAFTALLPALVWMVWRRQGWKGVVGFVVATAPGWIPLVGNLGVGLSHGEGAETVWGLAGGSGFLPVGAGAIAWQPVATGLLYWPGLGATPTQTMKPEYLAAGAVLSPLLLAAIGAWIWRRPSDRPGSEAVILAVACWAGALAVSGYEELAGAWRVDPAVPDGLRYCWPWPLFWTAAAVVCAPQIRFGRWLLWALVAVNAVGFGLQVVHSQPPTPWSQVAGYQSLRIRTREWPPELKPGIHPDRQNRHAFWFCQTIPVRGMPADWDGLDAAMGALPLDPSTRDECLRGVGMSLARGICRDEPWACVPPGAPEQAVDRLWQGFGMAAGCGDPQGTLRAAGREHDDAVWWGLGRVEIQCLGEWDRRRRRAPASYIEGWRAGWSYDVAAPGHRDVDPAKLPSLRFYNFRWVQGPEFVEGGAVDD